MNRTIIISLALVAVLGILFLVKGRKGSRGGTAQVEMSDGFAAFQAADLSGTSRIHIAKGKAAPVELEKKDDQWVVASAHGYKADSKVAGEIIASAGKIREGVEVSERSANHKSFEVDDIRGTFITFYGGDKKLGSLVVGKTAQSRNLNKTLIFVRFGADDETYKIASKLRSDAKLWSKIENKNYLEKEIFKLESEEEVFELRLSRPGQDDLLVERKSEEVPVEEEASEDAEKAEKKEGGEKKAPGTTTVEYFVATSGSKTQRVDTEKEWSAKSLVDKGRSLRIEDVSEPKDLAAYGLDKPQLKASYRYRVKGKADAPVKELSVLFGNAVKDEKGEDKEYFLTLTGEGNAGRIYTVSKWTYEGWDKKFEDFLPEPKEKKPGEGAGGEANGTTPVIPGPPVPGNKPAAGVPPVEEKKDSSAGAGSDAGGKLPGAGAEDGGQSNPSGG
ncbi:MAG: DUF4340 domain-containing protein [Planctomycetota bacterium]|nr:DUF4340 domain-containing protein [Planctomycetota bacterium]